MLIKDFYKIEELQFVESGFKATVKLNPNHDVYKGHFPEQPVVPGVIQLQIVKELVEEVTQLKLMMTEVIQVKYLIPVTPDKNAQLTFTVTNTAIAENQIKSNIVIGFDDSIFTKAKIIFSFD